MSEILRSLRDDHARMTKVLDALEEQLDRVNHEKPVDRAVFGEAVDYCLAYPAQIHHKKEDILMRWLRTRDDSAAAAVGDLEAEHARLTRLTTLFTAGGNDLVSDEGMPSGEFVQITKDFVNAYRVHIETEERYFLPAVLWSLTPEDWTRIEREIEGLSPRAPESEASSI